MVQDVPVHRTGWGYTLMIIKQQLDECQHLLRSAYDLLQNQVNSSRPLNLLNVTIQDGYGGDILGSDLMENIELALDIEEEEAVE